jgi:hypothetical protein
LVASINKPKYKTIELKIIFGPLIFDKDQQKSWSSTKQHHSDEAIGNFGSITNSNLDSTMNNFGLEYSLKDSTLEVVFGFFWFGIDMD